MNVISAIKTYITKMIEDSGPGMKVLLMDSVTTSIVSMVFSQSEILQKEVYLFEKLDSLSNESVRHLKCIVFIRPTQENILLLAEKLKYPKYNSYYIYVSNILPKADVKTLAESDEQEVVKEITEVYADYLAVSPHFFSLGIPQVLTGLHWNQQHLLRSVQGLMSLLLSLKKSALVRYQANSDVCRRLAEGVRDVLTKESALCSFPVYDNAQTVLLILDRRDDPITPLLNQWTYQAMVHELLGISTNRVRLPDNQDMKEVVLCTEQDEFYANNLYLNFGEIGLMIKELMEDFQTKAKNHQTVQTIQDMKNFVETYPMFKKMSGTVSKHVNIVDKLSEYVGKLHLMEVSELEQELVCQSDHSQQLQRIRRLINQKTIRDIDATRLVLLYCIRYESHSNNDITGLMEALKSRQVPDKHIKLVQLICDYGGEHVRQSDLFGDAKAVEKIKKRLFDLKGVDNVFTRHTPVLRSTIEDLLRGKLREQAYPCINGGSSQLNKRVQDVIVFMVGGTTYEESLTVHQLNLTLGDQIRIILGGTTILNSAAYFEEIETAMNGVTPRRKHRMHNI